MTARRESQSASRSRATRLQHFQSARRDSSAPQPRQSPLRAARILSEFPPPPTALTLSANPSPAPPSLPILAAASPSSPQWPCEVEIKAVRVWRGQQPPTREPPDDSRIDAGMPSLKLSREKKKRGVCNAICQPRFSPSNCRSRCANQRQDEGRKGL